MKKLLLILILSMGIGMMSVYAQLAVNERTTISVTDESTGVAHSVTVGYYTTSYQVVQMLGAKGVNINSKVLIYNNEMYLFKDTTMGSMLNLSGRHYFSLTAGNGYDNDGPAPFTSEPLASFLHLP